MTQEQIMQYYLCALSKGEQNSIEHQQIILANAKRSALLLNSVRNNLIRNFLEGNESMQYYFILTLLIEY